MKSPLTVRDVDRPRCTAFLPLRNLGISSMEHHCPILQDAGLWHMSQWCVIRHGYLMSVNDGLFV